MKLRNQLLALACLLAFIAFGYLYFRTWVVQKPFGIILFVSDGLVENNLAAARLYEGGADHRLNIERLGRVALLTNFANDFAVPDSAAAASALATGVKVNNQRLSSDAQGKALPTILEAARESGRATGIITTGNLSNPGIAAFYAHSAKSDESEAIAAQLVDNTAIDVILGGGGADFLPESKGGHRKDGRDLILEMKQKGSEIFRSKAELENSPVFTTASRAGLFSEGDLPYSNQISSGSQQPSLSDMVRRAIEFLQYNPHGYFLVVDTALVTHAAEQNDAEHLITETLELDRAVATALRFAGPNTLLIAAGKHATGGMALNGYPLRQDHSVALLGTNTFGHPSISWASGPNGPQPPASPETSSTNAKSAPAAFFAPAAINNAGDVLAVGAGPGSEPLSGFMDNTAIYQILKNGL
jgi:alkaline phosphatase